MPVLALVVALATLAASPAVAKPAPAASGPVVDDHSVTTKDFRIETNESHANINTGEFTMPNAVKFIRPGTVITGDSAHGNFKDNVTTISGHVVMHDDGRSGQSASLGATSASGPSTLTCDELYVDSRRKQYTCSGHMHYVQGKETASADAGRLDQISHVLDLTGNVHLSNGTESFAGVTVHYNTVTRDVDLSGTPMELHGAMPAEGASPAPKPPKKK